MPDVSRSTRAYFDTAFVVKCYALEHGSADVRAFAAATAELVTSELVRAEFAAAIHRKRREDAFTRRDANAIRAQFDADYDDGVWTLLPVSSTVLERVSATYGALPSNVYVRAADAMHCASAVEFGLAHIYSNDQHLLAAAPHFKLRGTDLTAGG